MPVLIIGDVKKDGIAAGKTLGYKASLNRVGQSEIGNLKTCCGRDGARMMRIGRLRTMSGIFWPAFLFAAALPLSISPAVAGQRGDSVCAPKPGPGFKVVAVDRGFALLLEDGRLVWPAGIDAPAMTRDDPQFGEHGRQVFATRLVDKIAGLSPMASDRWGRIVAPVFTLATAEAAPADVAAMIVAAGDARVRPDSVGRDCLRALLRAESTARKAGLGLWADPSFSVLFADAPDTFTGRYGTLQIVEGRVTSIGESGPRTYLNFGLRRGADFAVVVTRENGKAFDRAGLPLHGLLGKRVRVRGLLDKGSGPQIEISSPDWLQIVEGT